MGVGHGVFPRVGMALHLALLLVENPRRQKLAHYFGRAHLLDGKFRAGFLFVQNLSINELVREI